MLRRQHGQNNNRAASEAHVERREMFQKTKMCKFFIVGACTQGANCKFAHNDSELSGEPDLGATKICKTLVKKGICKDPTCTYAHSREELRVVPGFNDDRVSFAKISKSLQAAEAMKQKAIARHADSLLRNGPAMPGDVAKQAQAKKWAQPQKPPQPVHHPQAMVPVASKPCPGAVKPPAFHAYSGAAGSSWAAPDGYLDGAMGSHASAPPSAQMLQRAEWYYTNTYVGDSDFSNDHFGGTGFSDTLRSEPWRVDALEQEQAYLDQEMLSKANLNAFSNSWPSEGGDLHDYESPEAAKMPSMQGTKVCRSLSTKGVCRDPQCKFAHSKEELRFIPGVNDDSASLAKIYSALAAAESMSAKFQSAEASSHSSKGRGRGKEAKGRSGVSVGPGASSHQYLASGSNSTSSRGGPWPAGPAHFEANDNAISGQRGALSEGSPQMMAERAGWYYPNTSFSDSDYSSNPLSAARGGNLASTLERFGLGSRASNDADGPDDGEYGTDVPLSPSAAHRLDMLGGFTINERRIASNDSGSAPVSVSDKAPPAATILQQQQQPQQREPVRIETSSLKSLSIHSRSVPPSVAMSEDGGDKLSPRVAKILDDPLPVSLSVKNTFLTIDDPQPEEKIRKTLSEGRLGVLGACLRAESSNHDLGVASGASLLAKSSSSLTRSRLGMQSRFDAFSNGLDLVPEGKRIFGRQQSVESGTSEFSNWNLGWQRQCTTESMASQADPIPEIPQPTDRRGEAG